MRSRHVVLPLTQTRSVAMMLVTALPTACGGQSARPLGPSTPTGATPDWATVHGLIGLRD